MKLVIFGAAGRIGSRILHEAQARGHTVTAALHATTDATRPEDVARAAAGQDAAINAIGPGAAKDVNVIPAAARALIAAGPRRLIIVGGAGTLEIRPGVQRLDTPDYPEIYRPSGYAQREALALYRASNLDWTYMSPPIIIEPGERTGRYRTGTDQVLFTADGRSRISMEDFAIALLDELEKPSHIKARFTVAD